MSNGFPEEHALKLDTLASKSMEKAHAPGASVSILKEGEVVYSKGYGGRDLERNLPATPDTLYGIGSCTKSFICLSVMQLAEKGMLDIRDHVRDYVPLKIGFADAPITLHHLMSHSSGMPSLGIANILIEQMSAGGHPIPLVSNDDFYSFLNAAREHLDARPGEKYFYFNGGYTLLGFVIEKVSGLPLEEYVRKNILVPLKMERTTYIRDKVESDSDAMTAYWKEKDGNLKATIHPYHRLIYAPGGLISSTNELTHYLNMYLDGGVYKDRRLLEAESLAEMWKPHIKRQPNIFGENYYGYGWGIMNFFGHELVVHTGSTGVSSAFLGFVPDLDIGVAYLSNTGYWSSSIPHAALALLMDKDPIEDIPYLKAEQQMVDLAGSYVSYRDILKVDVVRKGALLFAEIKGRWGDTSVPLIPLTDKPEETSFYFYNAETGKMRVDFVRENGKIRLYWERWVLQKTP